ncbi:DEAD/DEAH box helicase [Corynebacterium sp. CCUG 61414]|uniref:DEAD/DEAH box helicase n=1 Tax=Corynebacterium sp. CCUG 61414 TaxID=2823896 RepID=UPI0021089C86|nr:DEAD/DEAH box helicase [Corynebacterium sp. CCUG 61414]MCQ4610687.1 DEAD/DEAH box helicase [Corynebacterium sp. CCUG 61414]
MKQDFCSFGGELVRGLRKQFPHSTITHVEEIPAHPAEYGEWPEWVHPALRHALEERGVQRLFRHQQQCAEAAWRGEDVVVATGTSSGKSLGYQLPVLSALAADERACALYITPTKALGSDQLQATLALTKDLPGITPAPYDGDTPVDARRAIRDQSRFVFTNPDMLHASILGSHERWARLLRHLRFIVVDESHTYRGVFGANVSLVFRRLLRLARAYGSEPTLVFASATSAAPAEHAELLCGRPVREVDVDTAPTGERTVVLWEPGFIEGAEGEHGAPVRYAATTEAASIMGWLVREGARTLTFVRSRPAAEIVAMRAQEDLSAAGRPDFARRIAAYRAGYLAEDRRALERALDEGEILGMATTNALELGIDVGGLDAVVMAGYPGTVASFRQQAGRAGRRGQGSLVVLVARDEPMDAFLVHHPEALLGRPVERSVFNPSNPYILRGHLYHAALERPLTSKDVDDFGAHDVVEQMCEEGLLRKRPRGWFPAPDADVTVSIRGGAGAEVMIVDVSDGRLLGTVDAARALTQVHEGAVYVHQGEHFVVQELNLDDYVALVEPAQPDYTTRARSTTDIRILGEAHETRQLAKGVWVASVDVEVTDRVTGYVVRLADGSVSEHIPLDLPAQHLETRAVAYTIDPLVLDSLGISAGEVPGALHAAEHAAIGLLPLIATCDRWDIGGVSTALHQDTLLPTVFVYDGHPGGAGMSDEGFARFHTWITATYGAVESCPCEHGCPSCIQSPKCGNGNQPLDKQAALKVLALLSKVSSVDAENREFGA